MAEQRTGGLSTGLRVVLVVSLALNLAVAGVAAGWWLRHGGGARGMRNAMRAQGGPRGALLESMAALVADLRTEPFDASKVAARLAEQRAVFAARFEMGQAALVAHLANKSASERAAYADRLEAEIAAYHARRRRE